MNSFEVGPIQGVPVGTLWQNRIQVSESRVHRPPQAGIHGRGEEGAFSIVLGDRYTNNEDQGEAFWYSGCGRNDQELKGANRSLAISCAAPVAEDGAVDAGSNWRGGRPIRVVRQRTNTSPYAPIEAPYRYDGIYKVDRYYYLREQMADDEIRKIYMFHLRRDDPEPAPWTQQ